MLWKRNIVYGAFFASITLAGTKARHPHSGSHPSHRHGLHGRLKNLTVLPRSDAGNPQQPDKFSPEYWASEAQSDPSYPVSEECLPAIVYDDPELWGHYALVGKRLNREWRSQPMDRDKDSGWDAAEHFLIEVERNEDHGMRSIVGGVLRQFVPGSAGELHIQAYYEKYTMLWPKRPQKPVVKGATFECNLSTQDGVFIAQDIIRGDMPKDWTFSDIAWYLWWTAVGSAVGAGFDFEYSRLKYFIIETWSADNPRMWTEETKVTNAILNLVFKGGNARTKHFYPRDTSLGNPFWVVLGSPLGASIIGMLTERKGALKGIGIRSLSVKLAYLNDEQVYTMWATLEPTPTEGTAKGKAKAQA